MARIAVFGPLGTFTDEAARQYFKEEGEVGYAPTITAVFEEVSSGRAAYGVVPIENSSEGSVGETIECLRKYDVRINGEVYLQIRHVLAGVGKLIDVRQIISHPQAIAQCAGKIQALLGKKLPKVVTKLRSGEDYSTARAMAKVAKLKDPKVAALGSRMAAERYGLKILIDNLADREDNETRFFVISKKGRARTGKDKTSIMVAVKDEAGALYKLLGAFAKENINLTKIESRPRKDKKWEYIFLIDFEGHAGDGKLEKVLSLAKDNTTYYKLFGSYPRG
jgi:chorismate mutase/prephenate dehydratase